MYLRFICIVSFCWFAFQNSYAQTSDSDTDLEDISLQKVLYLSGELSGEDDILSYVNGLNDAGVSYEAASVLKAELNAGRVRPSTENYLTLANLFFHAREDKEAETIVRKAIKFVDRLNPRPDIFNRFIQGDIAFERLSKAGYCQTLGAVLGLSNLPHRDKSKARLYQGYCYHEIANNIYSSSMGCVGRSRLIEDGVGFEEATDRSVDVLSYIQPSEKGYKKAAHWMDNLKDLKSRAEGPCRNYINPMNELCFIKIKQAYDAEVFIGKFKLDDKTCEPRIAEYDSIFRMKTSKP